MAAGASTKPSGGPRDRGPQPRGPGLPTLGVPDCGPRAPSLVWTANSRQQSPESANRVYLLGHLSVSLSVCVYLYDCLSVCLSVCLTTVPRQLTPCQLT